MGVSSLQNHDAPPVPWAGDEAPEANSLVIAGFLGLDPKRYGSTGQILAVPSYFGAVEPVANRDLSVRSRADRVAVRPVAVGADCADVRVRLIRSKRLFLDAQRRPGYRPSCAVGQCARNRFGRVWVDDRRVAVGSPEGKAQVLASRNRRSRTAVVDVDHV